MNFSKNNHDLLKITENYVSKLFQFTLKSTLACMLFSLSFNITAQTVSTAYQTQINSTFAGVDKTKVPHKLLVDYAMEFAELSAFNGTLTGDNLTHRGHYTAIYNTLLMARVQTGVPGLVSPTTFKTNWDNLRQPNKIVLSGLYYKYNKFKDNASPNYITISNNKLYDKYVNGVWQNPYEERQVFAMASSILKYNDLSVDVELPLALWYTNQASAVQSIAIDFGDGAGYQTMAFGQIRTITYTQSGLYEWIYKLTLTNSQVLYSHSKIQVEGTAPKPLLALRSPNEPCTVNALGIDEVEFNGTRTYLGQANTATLEIDYALNDCMIHKPLIVVEGFDSGILGVENPLGERDYASFILEATSFTGNLAGEITDYDIIYINWDSGNDYLQRNAYLLEEIIVWVNANKTGSEPNVVLGQSMGGVIARYALRDMEDISNLDHDTSLFISHDAPHQGANIPLGIQYFARHLVDQFVSTPLGDMNINPNDGAPVTIEQIENLINAPGTKQLLKNSVASNFAEEHSIHDTWQADLLSKGYPQLTRNIAVSNGSHCASPQAFSPSDILFSLNGNGKTSLLTDFVLHLLGPISDLGFVVLAILFDEPVLLVGIIPGNSKFNMDFNAKALPNVGSTSQIYKGKITFTKKILWLINLTVTITDRSFNNPPGILSYDYYPGGKFPVPFDFENSSVDNLLGSLNINAFIIDDFDFIPTPSALDVGSNNTTLTNPDYLKVYTVASPPTGNKAIPFDNFTTSYNTSSINEPHISFNARNGNWLAEELDGDANNGFFDCSFICSTSSNIINGYGTLCTSGVYSVNTAGDAVVNWSLSNPSAATLSSSTGSSVTLTAVSGYKANITLTANISSSNCGGSAILTKSIRVGKPDTPASLTGPSTVNTGALVSYKGGVSNGATSYTWYLPYPYTTVSSFDYFGQDWQLLAPGNSTIAQTFTGYAQNAGYVQVMGTNDCGTGSVRLLYVQHGSGGGGGIPRIDPTDNVTEVSLYPNPAKNKVTVSLTHLTEYDGEPPTVIYGIKIMDLNLVERQFYQFKEYKNQEEINVAFLTTGLYTLTVYTDTATFTKKLLIE